MTFNLACDSRLDSVFGDCPSDSDLWVVWNGLARIEAEELAYLWDLDLSDFFYAA